MTTETVKSTQITNLDASPAVASTKGEGAAWREKSVDAFVASTTGVTTGSKYLLHRIPSFVIVKNLIIATQALAGSSAADFGLYYADDARYLAGGSANAGVVIDADFFTAAQTLVSALGFTDITLGNVLAGAGLNKLFLPIWQAAGLSSDPGGYFDIVATTTATINTGGKTYSRCRYVE